MFPGPVRVSGIEDGLALGAEQKNTICITSHDFALLSQYLGDLRNGKAYDNFKFIIQHFKDLYQLKPNYVAYDLHPDYQSTHHAELISNTGSEETKRIGIQHHHAHIASCMVENNIDGRVIGLAFDGTGMGSDGNIWGGEFLLCNVEDSKRVGYLNYMRMPGGEKAIREPWRMAVSYFYRLNYDKSVMMKILDINEKELEIVLEMLEKDFNCVKTSSMGRLFDTVAALIGLRKKISYQAQAAVELETAISDKIKETYNYEIQKQGKEFIINTDMMIKGIYYDYSNGMNISIISAKFHNTVIEFSLNMCKLLRNKYGIKRVVLSGGVFQNEILFEGIYNDLEKANFTVYTHTEIPCNDGGLSLGQLVIAGRRERSGD